MGVGTVANGSKAAVFLDRDGVLNDAIVVQGRPYAPRQLSELRVCSDAPAALNRLRDAGFALIAVSNQPDVARGRLSRSVAEAIGERVRRELALDGAYACYHDGEGCACRKPAPGLILRGAAEHGIDLPRSWLIGDRWKDVAAATNAGVRSVFLDRHYDEAYLAGPPAFAVDSLQTAVDCILGRREQPA